MINFMGFAKQCHMFQNVNTAKRSIYTAVKSANNRDHAFVYGDYLGKHLGVSEQQTRMMLNSMGYTSIEAFVKTILPHDTPKIDIERISSDTTEGVVSRPMSEAGMIRLADEYASMNAIRRSFLGQGFHKNIMPEVIRQQVQVNPSWYSPYTPYQAEFSQGRLEVLLTYQTLITQLTGLPIANASLLDEGSAAVEAMMMLYASGRADSINEDKRVFLVHKGVSEATVRCLKTMARCHDITIQSFDSKCECPQAFGIIFQYPDKEGRISDIENFTVDDVPIVVIADPMALLLLKPPSRASVMLGSMQRFGLPMGFGGPHAAFFATTEEYKRRLPGRIIGLSKDIHGKRAFRMALQTREQHVRREKATSNICTSQVLPAVLSTFYAIYHGPEGLKRIASRINEQALFLANAAIRLGHEVVHKDFFDTITIKLSPNVNVHKLMALARDSYNVLLRTDGDDNLVISTDEATDDGDLDKLLGILAMQPLGTVEPEALSRLAEVNSGEKSKLLSSSIPDELRREKPILNQEIFTIHRSELQLMRLIKRLESKDYSLTDGMIPLGSCSMKLNPAVAIRNLSLSGWTDVHPGAAKGDTRGYEKMMEELKSYLSMLTGFPVVSLRPNSGAQGELTALMAIKAYLKANGQGHKDICLVPQSAHGTNPASAAAAGFKVIFLRDSPIRGVDKDHLEETLITFKDRIAVMMITYPSTFGTFQPGVRSLIERIHSASGLVYIDGANMNALMGHVRFADLGADACHLNLHKTFGIPHGGGGPGVGPVCISCELGPFLEDIHVTSAPHGSASILPIAWSFVRMLGLNGLKRVSSQALLQANYMKSILASHYPIICDERGNVAHEFILDCRQFKDTAKITVQDISKRLQDYSVHAPTMGWPLADGLKIEPTESESLEEINRICNSLIAIRQEIHMIESGKWNVTDNPLKGAPHTLEEASRDEWKHSYSRNIACWPLGIQKDNNNVVKRWPSVGTVDDIWGEEHFCCSA